MRIGLDVTPLAVPLTGIGNVVRRFAGAIDADAGFSLAPFALTGRGSDHVRQNLPNGASLPRALPAAVLHAIWKHVDLPNVHHLAGGPVDIVHGTNFYGIPGGGVPELITIHDTGPWLRPTEVAPAVRTFPRLVDRALKRGAHVHTLSFAAGAEIGSLLQIAEDRIHPIQIGFDPPVAATSRPSGLKVTPEDRFILAIGSIEPRKRLPQLVETLAPLLQDQPQLHLVIAGAGPDTEILDRTIAAQARTNTRVHRLGYVSAEEKSWLLRAASVVVSNSSSEGFGMVPLEAMSVGTPTVATDGAVQREVCGQGSLLVPVDDPDALRSGIEQVWSDDQLRAQLISAGETQAAHFTWERTTQELLALYRSLHQGR